MSERITASRLALAKCDAVSLILDKHLKYSFGVPLPGLTNSFGGFSDVLPNSPIMTTKF